MNLKRTIEPFRTFALLIIAIGCLSISTQPATADNWPGFRGDGNSRSSIENLPLHWSVSENTAWTADLAGGGQSSPVIWGDKVFVTSLEGENKERLHVYAFGLQSGETLWHKTFQSSFPQAISDYISKAAPTPTVDAERIYFLFESGDFFALNHDGEEIWNRKLTEDFGKFGGDFVQGASPVLTGSGVVVLADHDGGSWIASFNKSTGETFWKTDRETALSWASPLVIERARSEQIICSSGGSVTSYNADDGELLWSFTDVAGNTVPSPSIAGDNIVIGGGDRQANLVLKLNATGPFTAPAVAWKAEEVVSNFGSPLIHNGRVYFINRNGVLFCYSLESGELLFDHRLPESNWASPLGIGNQVWFFCVDGSVIVLETSDTASVLAENKFELKEGERIYGYAIVPGTIIARTQSRLIAVRK